MSRPAHLRRVTSASSPAPAAPVTRPKAPAAGLVTARVEAILAGGGLLVKDVAQGTGAAIEVRVALIAGYVPSAGDLLLVSRDGGQSIAIAVVEAARAPGLIAKDGARAELVRGGIEFRDAEGRLLLRYLDGALEVAPSHGDLRLRAPSGRVEIEAGTDVAIHAARDLKLSAAKSTETTVGAANAELPSRLRVDAEGTKVSGRAFELRSRSARAVSVKAELIATDLGLSAKTIVTHARKIETTAERVTLRAKEAVEDIAGLLETRVGRMRSLVRGAFSLRSKSTNMKSEEDTSVDGRRVLLG